MFFKRKKKKDISRKQRVEIYKGSAKKRGLVFSFRIGKSKNVPKQYANEVYGRPEKSMVISYSKIFLVLVIVSGLAYVALFSPIFQIKKILVVNNQVLLEGDIVKFLEDRNIKNKNLFLVNTNQVRDVLKEYYKRIDDVRVYRVFPAQLKIKITEKPSTVVWQVGDRNFLLDNNGVVIADQVAQDVKMPIVLDQSGLAVKIGDRPVTKNFIDFVNIADESLKKRFGLGVAMYSINQTTFELKAHINSGFYILFDTTGDIVEQLDKLSKVYQQGEVAKEYIILSVADKVIVK